MISATFLLLTFLMHPAVEPAMFANRPIVYNRNALYSYRHSIGVSKFAFIDTLREYGLLRTAGHAMDRPPDYVERKRNCVT